MGAGGYPGSGLGGLFPGCAVADCVEVEAGGFGCLESVADVLSYEGGDFYSSFFYVEDYGGAGWGFRGCARHV